MEVHELAEIFEGSHDELKSRIGGVEQRLRGVETSSKLLTQQVDTMHCRLFGNGQKGELEMNKAEAEVEVAKVDTKTGRLRERIEKLEKRWVLMIGLAFGNGIAAKDVISGIAKYIQAGG